MRTPIYDFVSKYVGSDMSRFHMPGHKGQSLLDCEARDITEISGADALYEAFGVVGESEANAAELFGTGKTLYSTEGSTQCIKAMLELARRWWQKEKGGSTALVSRPAIVAARNVHKAFLYAVIALDLDVVWLWPEEENPSLCSCVVTSETLERVLSEQGDRVAAVYITSPNYLGGIADVSTMAKVCRQHNTLLCVDNAHGAYLHFLNTEWVNDIYEAEIEKISKLRFRNSLHPMDSGADLCCDSAHKTLPVLTGGAYLHISKTAPKELKYWAKGAMELFGSTSPSYLILQSLDLCNRYLAQGYRERLKNTCELLENCRKQLQNNGWQVEEADPLRITIKAPLGLTGADLAEQLRKNQIECEFADEDYLVLMATPENSVQDFERLINTFGENKCSHDISQETKKIPLAMHAEQVMTIREAYFAEGETIPAEQSQGRICRMPMAACPPAIPVVVPGEVIDDAAVKSFLYYGIETIEVLKEELC